jgi:hypothetical protein
LSLWSWKEHFTEIWTFSRGQETFDEPWISANLILNNFIYTTEVTLKKIKISSKMNNENEQFHFCNFDLIFHCFVYQRILTKLRIFSN